MQENRKPDTKTKITKKSRGRAAPKAPLSLRGPRCQLLTALKTLQENPGNPKAKPQPAGNLPHRRVTAI